nr:Guanine nucleotide binding protein (G-protein) domain containing protein [Haemonchus contortus]
MNWSFRTHDVCLLEDKVEVFKDDFKVLYDFKHREKLSDKVVASLLAVSRTSLLEECQRKKRILPMPYNYKYFVQHTNRMIADGYLPTEADILYSYTPTIGLDGHVIRLGKSRYDVLELPGHRIFRRRWSDFFRNTSVVVFLIDLCELCDNAFYTGHLKNKTINIFERLVQNELLNRVGFILLFNKKDAFEDMARGFDFKQLSSNLRSPQDALSYYRTVFMAASPPKRSYHHVISLINAPNLGLTLGDSLSRIFKHNTQATTIT